MTVVDRKAEHLRIAAGAGVEHTGGTGFERLRLRHRALPEPPHHPPVANDVAELHPVERSGAPAG